MIIKTLGFGICSSGTQSQTWLTPPPLSALYQTHTPLHTHIHTRTFPHTHTPHHVSRHPLIPACAHTHTHTHTHTLMHRLASCRKSCETWFITSRVFSLNAKWGLSLISILRWLQRAAIKVSQLHTTPLECFPLRILKVDRVIVCLESHTQTRRWECLPFLEAECHSSE